MLNVRKTKEPGLEMKQCMKRGTKELLEEVSGRGRESLAVEEELADI